jgi:hypothetical protein
MDVLTKKKIKESKKNSEALSMPDLYNQVGHVISEMIPWTWLVDCYIEEGTGKIFAILAQEGLLYQAPLIVSDTGVEVGELKQVVIDFKPVVNSFRILQNVDGTVRWFLIAASTVINRNGFINSSKLFENLKKRTEESGKYPYLTFFHCGEAMKMGMTDWMNIDGSLFLLSGLFDDSKQAECMQEAYAIDPAYWGSSISFYPLAGDQLEVAEGVKIPVYIDGEFDEVSILPEKDACCLFTALQSKGKVNEMKKEVEDAIRKLAGDNKEVADGFISKVDEVNKDIVDQGLVHLQKKTEEVVPPVTPPITPAPDPIVPTTEVIPPVETIPPVEVIPPVVKPEEDKPEDKPEDVEDIKPKDIDVTPELQKLIAQKLVGLPEFSSLLKKDKDAVEELKKEIIVLKQEVTELRVMKQGEFKKLDDRLKLVEKEDEDKKKIWQEDIPRNQKFVATVRAKDSQDEDIPASLEEIAAQTVATMNN